MIKLTAKAGEEVLRLIKEGQESEDFPKDEELVLRVMVKGGGCSGFSYQMGFQVKSEIEEADVTCESEGINIVVDDKSNLYLNGTTIDFQDGLAGKGFTFDNPQSSGSCGCGESFSA